MFTPLLYHLFNCVVLVYVLVGILKIVLVFVTVIIFLIVQVYVMVMIGIMKSKGNVVEMVKCLIVIVNVFIQMMIISQL